MMKHPKKLLSIIDDKNAITCAIDKIIHKSKFMEYELEKYALCILELKPNDYSQICLDHPGHTPESLGVFVEKAFAYYFKQENDQAIESLLSKGYHPKPEGLMYNLCKYLKSGKNDKMLEIYRQVDWSRVNKISYCHIYGNENLDKFLGVVGEHNLSKKEIHHLFKTNLPNCNAKMLEKFLCLGASIYVDGKLDEGFLKDRVYFPEKGTYGHITLNGRRHLTQLVEDKTPDNPAWLEFVQKSFLNDSSDVRPHLIELIKDGDATPAYGIEPHRFFKVFVSLGVHEMSQLLPTYKNIDESALIKAMLEHAPDKIEVLLEQEMNFNKFFKSTYAKSLQTQTGFTKKIPDYWVDEMRQAFKSIGSSILADKLEDNLAKSTSHPKKRKI